MKRQWKIFKARWKRFWYLIWLLLTDINNAEAGFDGYEEGTEIKLIASCRGSMFDNTLEIKKVFYDERRDKRSYPFELQRDTVSNETKVSS